MKKQSANFYINSQAQISNRLKITSLVNAY